METNNRITTLIAKKLTTSLTRKEQEELNTWVSGSEENARLYNRFMNKAYVAKKMRRIYAVDKKAGWKRFKRDHSIKEKVALRTAIADYIIAKYLIVKRPFAIGFPILLLLGLIAYGFFKRTKKNTDRPLVNVPTYNESRETPHTIDRNNIFPIGNKATLSLQNGFEKDLDKAPDGLVAEIDSVQLNKQYNAQLDVTTGYTNFTTETVHQATRKYTDTSNVIRTPRNGQWMLILSDGTHVWLNASSSISFPLRFDGKERVVSISGEAYFEVTPKLSTDGQTKIPFVVLVNGKQQVLVTGTKFNITAYADEKPVTTTLVEGAVELIRGTKRQRLQPGQQVAIDKSGQFSKVTTVNTSEIIAWKSKEIIFKRAPIEMVMDRIKRLYDADISYDDVIDYHFNVDIAPGTPLSEVLEILSATGEVHFKGEGRKIIVTK